MSRLDVRCKVNLPVSLIYGNGGREASEKKASFSVISLNGAYIDYKNPLPEKKIFALKYELPKHGEFEMLGEVIHKEKAGMAVKFYNVNRDTKIKLWDFIKENITQENKCPYCGAKNERKVIKCSSCGWTLNFDSPDYLVKHEKESYINRLSSKGKAFTLEDIYKILNFIDVEILGVGKSLEINEEFVGSSKPMLEVFSRIRKAAPTDTPVLITGESGTGKKLTARAIHERSPRKEKPFINIDCSAIHEDLLEAELFGYEKGAFSNAENSRPGKLEYADGGTVFLSNIRELPVNLQLKLLSFMENRTVGKTGARTGKKVDVRVIASAEKLRAAVSQGIFNKDLFHRLDAFSIDLLPVNERGDDKIILARYFLNKFARDMNVHKKFSSEAMDSIRNYDWPGNVREIVNKVRRAVVVSSDAEVQTEDLDMIKPTTSIDSISTLRDIRSTMERQKLIEALQLCRNNISKTAKVLGISRPSVYSLKKKYRI